jgi:hypothetical protein
MHHTFTFEALNCDAIPSGIIKAYQCLVSSYLAWNLVFLNFILNFDFFSSVGSCFSP